MGIKLRILAAWTPKFIIKKELKGTTKITNNYLDRLIVEQGGSPPKQEYLKGNLDKRRKEMAMGHNRRVKLLIDLLGEPMAMEEGRKRMFEAGLILGQHAQKVLGVGDNVEDTIKAAKILYKILGIEFSIENTDGNIILWVSSCVLSKYYSSQTCSVLSYADKGVLKGLNKNMDLKFVEKITSGSKRCKACINMGGGI
ncbi:MAG: hypothetical protein NKF70_05635 [Methanobacterium sp. ERen5]|nr:MAG: hypothetical protein NKF70_05635 [Methanobacterium sp. ERen5]